MNDPYSDEEAQRTRVERLPQSIERAISQENIRAALDVTRRVHRANPSFSPAIQPEHSEIWRLSEEIKLREAEALYAWALTTKCLWDADEFTRRWYESGCIEGGENQIVSAGDIVHKRNDLAFHTSYLEYFERLVLHNWLFPNTLYVFEGLMLVQEPGDEYPQLRPVVSQKALRGVRGATRDEVESLMNQLGLVRRYEDNYVNADQTLFVFDPVIYLTSPSIDQ